MRVIVALYSTSIIPIQDPFEVSSSRIKDLLHSDDPLLEVEKDDLRELVDESRSAVAALDEQIIEARQTLEYLIQKRQTA